jgi:hypothetical protein
MSEIEPRLVVLEGSDRVYETFVKPYLSKFKSVSLTNEDVKKLKDKVEAIKKVKEKEYWFDSGSMEKRWMTGWGGELAVEKYLGLKVADFTIGKAYNYAYSDLKEAGYDVGVKTCNEGDFPLLKKPSVSSQINTEIFVMKRDDLNYLICGLGSREVLNNPKNYSSLLVRSPSVRHKACFYRFDLLKHDFSLEDLREYCS